MMGLEEHLLGMFREDFEYNDSSAPSHLGGAKKINDSSNPLNEVNLNQTQVAENTASVDEQIFSDSNNNSLNQSHSGEVRVNEMIQLWTREAELELKKIPFFVRGKAKRNTEKFAKETGVQQITVDTLYDAKAHFKS